VSHGDGRGPNAAQRLDELRAEARYARERFDLYKARAYGPRATSEVRMRELERICLGAEARLRAAVEAQRPHEDPNGPTAGQA
jgi:hypothetical protein